MLNMLQEMILMNENVVLVYQLQSALRSVQGQQLEMVEEAIAKKIVEIKRESEERWGVHWDLCVAIHDRGFLGVKGVFDEVDE